MKPNLAEIFKPIPGFKNVEINADGTFVRIDGQTCQTKINKQENKSDRRYTYIHGKMFHVNRLVAKTFVANPNNKPLALSINGDATNCAYTNLKWGDHYEKHKLRVINNNEKQNIDLLITGKQAKQIAAKLEKGHFAKDLAKEYNTSHATITRVRKQYLEEKHGNKRYHRSVKEHVFELFEKGFTPIEISKVVSIRYETLFKWSRMPKEKVVNGPSGHLQIYDLLK